MYKEASEIDIDHSKQTHIKERKGKGVLIRFVISAPTDIFVRTHILIIVWNYVTEFHCAFLNNW